MGPQRQDCRCNGALQDRDGLSIPTEPLAPGGASGRLLSVLLYLQQLCSLCRQGTQDEAAFIAMASPGSFLLTSHGKFINAEPQGMQADRMPRI